MSVDFHDLKIGDELSLALYLAQMEGGQVVASKGPFASPLLYCVPCARKCRDELWLALQMTSNADPDVPAITIVSWDQYPTKMKCDTCHRYLAET